MARLTAEALMAPGGLLDAGKGFVRTLLYAPMEAAQIKDAREQREFQKDMALMAMHFKIMDEVRPGSAGALGTAMRGVGGNSAGATTMVKAGQEYMQQLLSNPQGRNAESHASALANWKSSPASVSEMDVADMGLFETNDVLGAIDRRITELEREKVTNPKVDEEWKQLRETRKAVAKRQATLAQEVSRHLAFNEQMKYALAPGGAVVPQTSEAQQALYESSLQNALDIMKKYGAKYPAMQRIQQDLESAQQQQAAPDPAAAAKASQEAMAEVFLDGGEQEGQGAPPDRALSPVAFGARPVEPRTDPGSLAVNQQSVMGPSQPPQPVLRRTPPQLYPSDVWWQREQAPAVAQEGDPVRAIAQQQYGGDLLAGADAYNQRAAIMGLPALSPEAYAGYMLEQTPAPAPAVPVTYVPPPQGLSVAPFMAR